MCHTDRQEVRYVKWSFGFDMPRYEFSVLASQIDQDAPRATVRMRWTRLLGARTDRGSNLVRRTTSGHVLAFRVVYRSILLRKQVGSYWSKRGSV